MLLYKDDVIEKPVLANAEWEFEFDNSLDYEPEEYGYDCENASDEDESWPYGALVGNLDVYIRGLVSPDISSIID